MLEKCDLGSMVAQHPPFSRHATSTVRYFHQRNDMSPQKLGLWRNISISLIYRLVVHLDDSVPPRHDACQFCQRPPVPNRELLPHQVRIFHRSTEQMALTLTDACASKRCGE